MSVIEPPDIEVSIVICTRDNADNLRRTLQSIGCTIIPAHITCEILVIDNAASDDATAAVVRELPVLANQIVVRHIPEPRAGKGFAYNTGKIHAAGRTLIFTDDDVRVPELWVDGMVRSLLDGNCDAIAGGVRLAPFLQRPWMTDFHRGCLADTRRLQYPNTSPELVGANMAMSRRVFDRVAEFDQRLGPGGLGFADESLLSMQITEAGLRIRERLDIIVEHHCDSSRLARQYWVLLSRRMGQSWGYVSHHWLHESSRSMLLWSIKRSIRLLVWRLIRWRECHESEGMPEWEVRLRIEIAQFAWRWRHRHDIRHYTKRGLSPITPDQNPVA